jgi:hypothetical protein
MFHSAVNILWYIDPLLEANYCTAARKQLRDMFSARSAKQLYGNRGKVFSLLCRDVSRTSIELRQVRRVVGCSTMTFSLGVGWLEQWVSCGTAASR